MSDVWTVRRLLEWTTPFFTRKDVDSPRLSAELLLSHILKIPRIKLYTDYERPLLDLELAAYRDLVKRASEHEPIGYLTGKAHFFNLEFHIGQGVLIPRPDTETLVEQVLNQVKHEPGLERPRILDLCTGSGCIALALAKHLPEAVVVGADKSPKALEYAQKNAQELQLHERVTLLQGDLYEALAELPDRSPFHLIVANPPYIAKRQMVTLDRNVRDYEPWEALEGGADGLDIHRRILAEMGDWLRPGGRVYMEIAFDQMDLAMQLLSENSVFEESRAIKDFGGNWRVITARRKP